MAKKLTGYKLSKYVDFDLDDIFDYTVKHHNFMQAVKYLTDLEIVFNTLVENPEIGRKRDELKLNLYCISDNEHIIFYRIQANYIRIVRVLHGSKDMPKHF